ncbi:MAG: hypothetical protein CL433_13205, partial [Acidimicrobiaceae bacterium]|nr:hypothetical protein [Acidimicrobiaceae bacterium]
MSADPPTGDRARPGFREVSIGADGVERAPNPMSEPPQSDPLPDGEAPGSRERSGDDDFMVGVVRWLERTGLFWPAAVTLAVFVLAGADAYVREKPGEGLAFAAIAVLVLVSRSRTLPAYQAAETFLGTSSLAVLVVVHITLLGPEPAALLLSFVAFVAARRWIERDPFGPTCLYLAVDVVVVGTEIDAQVDAWLASAGNALFSWPGFYWGLMFIPALYAHLKLDDWGRARFERPALRDDFGVVSAAAAVLLLAPPA